MNIFQKQLIMNNGKTLSENSGFFQHPEPPMKVSVKEFLKMNTIQILEYIGNVYLHQKDIANYYAECIGNEQIDFKKVNEKIMKRWSRSGLERIKYMAWKIWEDRELEKMADAFVKASQTTSNKKPCHTS